MPRSLNSLADLTADLREFARERDWEKFHDPKSLVLALTGEVGELAELFQWLPAENVELEFRDPRRKQRAAEEISDVLTYLLRLADVLDIDVEAAVRDKLADSRIRFAVDDVSGVAPVKE
ncbi:NTP pyrophosphatase, house-cleaning of non-canonical NTPs [Paraoerskovia marina]|uniref:NTP pyrophosphatase, house-cleaning of non-canonical NTPs n=1 Tax=Paraoerskovia marina TaxID=545619 RepID=A0A1H1NU11_9CELL|nr:nucleotide pyrophosphohydrolase [Paraoerskovia marina]SDS02433.1 NTP pyrophosphatase, house-cleaning of non-canonical NTPs [Paraoerskovia marina]